MKLEYDLEHTHAADNKKTKVISELTEKLQKSEAEGSKVSALLYQLCSRLVISYFGHCTGRPHASWLATMKNSLSSNNVSVKDATELRDELALDRPLWRLLAASGAMH